LELYEKVYVKPAFLESDHGEIPCQQCHGGNPDNHDWRTVHTDIIRDPTFPDPAEACGDCHEEIVKAAATSLHFTLNPMKAAIEKRAGNENPEVLHALGMAMDRHCLVCHASCGQCHVSRPAYARGGFLAGHRFVETPPMDTTCASCHGGRVHGEYTGANSDYEADVHYEDEEMTCMDCHKSLEMHAAAPGMNSRLDLPERPKCKACHTDDGENGTNRSHAIHRGKIACQVCHAQAAKSCFRCHVGTDKKGLPYFKCKETRILLKIGLNPKPDRERPEAYLVVRHPPIAPQTFEAYVKDGLVHFNDLPTWKPGFPHNIRRITRQNRACNNCHGNRALFLGPSDLAAWEIEANSKVVVPEDRIPGKVEEKQD